MPVAAVVGNESVKKETAESFLQHPVKGKHSVSMRLVIRPVLLHHKIIIKLQML